MSHQLQSLAYAGNTPWHGLGSPLPPRQSIEAWALAAGMNWRIHDSPVRYIADACGSPGALMSFKEQKVLYRGDTNEALSVVGSRYQVVQPREVLEFYRDLTEVAGFELESAGVLKAGRKFWALARTGKQVALKGNDVVNGYLLLATSCDGTLATTATPTTIRVVCNNTLNLALKGASCAVKVPHRTAFDAQDVKRQLGIAISQWDGFMYRMKTLAERKVKDSEAADFFRHVISGADQAQHVEASTAPRNERALAKVKEIFDGRGRGAELGATKGTAWGLLNAVTEFVDHERRARSAEYRLDSAWFGQGALLKQRALDGALALVD